MTAALTTVNRIERNGWQVNRVDAGLQLIDPDTKSTLYLSQIRSWLCLQRPITARSHSADADRARLYLDLLRRNTRLFMAKYSLDEIGQPLLAAEIPGPGNTAILFDRALEALVHYSASDGNPANGQPNQRPSDEAAIPYDIMGRYVSGAQAWGWGAKSEPHGATWYLGYKGRLRTYNAYLTPTRAWTYLQIPVLVEETAAALTAVEPIRLAFLEYLLRLNDALFMAKVGLSDEGQVLLIVDVPTEAFEFALFRLMTRTLGTYLDRFMQEIQLMAALGSDQKLASLLTS